MILADMFEKIKHRSFMPSQAFQIVLKTLFNIVEDRYKKLLNLMSVMYNDVQMDQ